MNGDPTKIPTRGFDLANLGKNLSLACLVRHFNLICLMKVTHYSAVREFRPSLSPTFHFECLSVADT